MSDMIVTKAVGLVTDTSAETTEAPNGSFEVVLSAPTLDRDNEVIDSRAFDPLPDHVPFDIDHGMTVTTTVGSGTPYYAEDGTLRVKGTYASTPLAQEVRTLVSEGHVRTTSVTFMAADRQKDEKGVMHVKTAELLNGTFTPVPSNRQAVVLSAKSVAAVTEEKAGARNNATDAQSIQAAHDLLVGLGASCVYKSTSGEGKALDDTDEDPAAMALAVDAAVDEAIALLAGVDLESLPAEVQQALALVQSADAAVDALLVAMGVPDPDETPDPADPAAPTQTNSADEATAKAAAPAAADAAADSAEEASETRKALVDVIENAAHFAFGG